MRTRRPWRFAWRGPSRSSGVPSPKFSFRPGPRPRPPPGQARGSRMGSVRPSGRPCSTPGWGNGRGKRALLPWPREARSPGGTLEDSRAPCDTRSAAESRATPKRIARIPWSASRCGPSARTRTTLATMLPVTAVMIDWSTAVVNPKGRYLELAVHLSTARGSGLEERVRAHQPPDGRRRVRALVGERPGLRRAHRRGNRGGRPGRS